MDIARIGKAPPTQHITLGGAVQGLATRHPAGTLGGGLDQVRGTLIRQVTQAILHRVDAGGEGQFVDVRLVGEAVGQR
ncbi:hypothetical protein FQZ97_1126760 [compost metagenome]